MVRSVDLVGDAVVVAGVVAGVVAASESYSFGMENDL